MPFLQETPRSIRMYLILTGVVGTIAMLVSMVSPEAGLLGRLLSLVGLAITLGYGWAGFTFKTAVVSHPHRIEQILIVGLTYSILISLIVLLIAPGTEEAYGTVARSAVGLLITLYLLKNVRRIARESSAPASVL